MADALTKLKELAVKHGPLLPRDLIELAEALEQVIGESFARAYLCRCLQDDELLAPLDEKIPSELCRKMLRSAYADWRSSSMPLPRHRLAENAGKVKAPSVPDTGAVHVQREQLSAELRNASHQLEAVQGELSLVKNELEVSRSAVAELTQVREALAAELTQARDELAQQGDALQHVRFELDARTAEIQTLKDRLALTERAFAKVTCDLAEKEACLRQKEALLPQDVAAWAVLMFQEHRPDLVDLAVFYSCASMLGMTDREGREFLNRFKRFDRDLFLAYMDDKERLGYWRKRYQIFLNQELQRFAVKWDLEGDVFDNEIHSSDESSGTIVTSVESALVTARSNNSCKLTAKVHTQK